MQRLILMSTMDVSVLQKRYLLTWRMKPWSNILSSFSVAKKNCLSCWTLHYVHQLLADYICLLFSFTWDLFSGISCVLLMRTGSMSWNDWREFDVIVLQLESDGSESGSEPSSLAWVQWFVPPLGLITCFATRPPWSVCGKISRSWG